ALEYLRRKLEAEAFRKRMQDAQPEFEAAISTLEPEITTLQQASGGRTVWVHITIWITSQDTVMGGMGFMSYDHAYRDAGLERASVGLDHRKDRSYTLGRPMSMPFQGGSATMTPRRELITSSVPIPYDPAKLDAAGRAQRVRHIEEDAARTDLETPVVQALFQERDAMISAGAH